MALLLETPPALAQDYYLAPDLRKKYLLAELVLFDEESAKLSSQIDWEPNIEAYQARTACRLRAGGLITTLPDAWPCNIHSPLAWEAKDIQDENDYVLILTNNEKAEINAALAHFQSRDQKSDAQSWY